jgi:hypothetical protein
MPSRSELAARRLSDNPTEAVAVIGPTGQEFLPPTRRDMANAIRALSMDAVQRGRIRSSWRADGHGRFWRSAVE